MHDSLSGRVSSELAMQYIYMYSLIGDGFPYPKAVYSSLLLYVV